MNPNPYEPPKTDSALRPEPPILAALVGHDGGMSIDFEIEQEDLVNFAIYRYRNSPAAGKRRWRRNVRLAIIFAVVLAYVAYRANLSADIWILLAGIVLVFLGILARYPWNDERQIRNMVERSNKESRSSLANGPRRVCLTPQCLEYASPHSQSEIGWIAVEKVVAIEDALYIYVSTASSIVVPRRAFSSDEHFQVFAHTAQEFHAQALAAENPLRTAV
jgi:hypothetical protein